MIKKKKRRTAETNCTYFRSMRLLQTQHNIICVCIRYRFIKGHGWYHIILLCIKIYNNVMYRIGRYLSYVISIRVVNITIIIILLEFFLR